MQNWKYTRLFPIQAPHVPSPSEFEELMELLSRYRPSNSRVSAGYTYFGQFVDHDLTFALENAVAPSIEQINRNGPVDVDTLTLARKPALDLDCMYGGGPADSRVMFERRTGKFVLGDTQFCPDRDFRRTADFQALIADQRNDENLLVAQIQVLFMNLHNRIVQDLWDNGVRDADYLYRTARREVIKIYQYLCIHDLLKALVPARLYQWIILRDDGRLSVPDQLDPTMALEFSDAAFRLHSMVRDRYRLNDIPQSISLQDLFERTGNGAAHANRKPPLLRNEDEVDWRHFFEFADYPGEPRNQVAMQISFVVDDALRNLDLPGYRRHRNLLQANLLRSIERGLMTGQQVCDALKAKFPLLAEKVQLQPLQGETQYILSQLSRNNSVRRNTPLWLYAMLEAGAGKLGTLGGWIVADTLRTAALSADVRLRNIADPRPGDIYGPILAMTSESRPVRIEDVIAYAYDYGFETKRRSACQTSMKAGPAQER